MLTPYPAAPREWVCVGAGGHARSVVDVLERAGHRVLVVNGRSTEAWHVDVIEDDGEARVIGVERGLSVALALGNNAARLRLARFWPEDLLSPVIASTASVSTRSQLARATVVMEQAHVGPGTHLLEAALVNTGAVAEHETVIGRAAHLGPGSTVLGGARVGDRSLIGAGAVVLPSVRVGDDCVVAAGAVVTDDIPSGSRVAGVPAHAI